MENNGDERRAGFLTPTQTFKFLQFSFGRKIATTDMPYLYASIAFMTNTWRGRVRMKGADVKMVIARCSSARLDELEEDEEGDQPNQPSNKLKKRRKGGAAAPAAPAPAPASGVAEVPQGGDVVPHLNEEGDWWYFGQLIAQSDRKVRYIYQYINISIYHIYRISNLFTSSSFLFSSFFFFLSIYIFFLFLYNHRSH